MEREDADYIAHCIRGRANRAFVTSPNVRELMRPKYDLVPPRILELDGVVETMNEMLEFARYDPKTYQNLHKLAGQLKDKALPTLGDIHVTSLKHRTTVTHRHNREHSVINKPITTLAKKIGDIFFEIRHFAERGKEGFDFVNTETDPRKVATGLLIMGYGSFIESFFEQDVKSNVVLAFQEVLLSKFSKGVMVRDVLPSMVATRENFGGGIRKYLDERAAKASA